MAAVPCKAASAQDHVGMCSHSHHPVTLEERRETAPTPRGGSEPPPFPFCTLSSFQATAHRFPSQTLPQVGQWDICRGPSCSRATGHHRDPTCGPCPPCPRRHSCQSRSRLSGLTIPPDAGREKLNKTSRQDDIKKQPARHSQGSQEQQQQYAGFCKRR